MDIAGLRGQLRDGASAPLGQHLARFGFGEQVGGKLARAEPRSDGGVAGGDEQPRARRIGEEGLDIGGVPDVIQDDERRLFAQQVAILGEARRLRRRRCREGGRGRQRS